MLRPFLTDAAFWRCVCAARLVEWGYAERDAERIAAELLEDPAYTSMAPAMSAEAFARAQSRAA